MLLLKFKLIEISQVLSARINKSYRSVSIKMLKTAVESEFVYQKDSITQKLIFLVALFEKP